MMDVAMDSNRSGAAKATGGKVVHRSNRYGPLGSLEYDNLLLHNMRAMAGRLGEDDILEIITFYTLAKNNI